MNRDKYIPVIPFNGKKEEFRTWKSKYECRLKIMGLIYILDDEIKITKDNEDYKSDTNKVKLKKKWFGVWIYYD